jgi:hypothetical protein
MHVENETNEHVVRSIKGFEVQEISNLITSVQLIKKQGEKRVRLLYQVLLQIRC